MYVAPGRKSFAHLDRLAAWKDGGTPGPVTVEWDLSNVCSLGCQFCHFAHTHVAGPWAQLRQKPATYSDTGRMADVALVERALVEMAMLDVKAIVWSGGGEPTLHPAFADLVNYTAELGLQQGIYTLGGHVTDDIAAAARHLSWAVVSLDCADADTYAAEKHVPASRFFDACQGVQKLAAQAPVVGVSFLLHAGNWRQTADMLSLARSLGATYATFRPTIETSPLMPSVCDADRSWITDAMPTLWELYAEPDVEIHPPRFEAYRDWSGHGYMACHGVTLVTMVTPDGRVWLCPNRRGMAGAELGDLRIETFAELWARHPASTPVTTDCRVMCRLHLENQTLATIYEPRQHEAFV